MREHVARVIAAKICSEFGIIARAMPTITLGLLGRIDEGQQAVEDLLKFKPDFTTRGRALIKHFMKFENILERFLRPEQGRAAHGIIL